MYIIISNQILKMFLLMMVGYISYRARLIDTQGNKALSNLLLIIINPCVILSSFQIEYTNDLLHGLLFSFLLAFLTHFVGIILSRFLFPAKNNPNSNVERFSCIYSNCGFMGIPLINGILGSEGVLYVTAYVVTFNVLCWTQGLVLMTGNTSWKQIKKGLLSPVMFGILLGLILFLARIRIPGVLLDTIDYVAAMNTPVGMMVAGIALAETDLWQALKNRRTYLVTAVKLLVIPAVMIAILAFLPINHTVLYTILVASACPAATTGTIFALRYNANYKYASEIFAFSTLASLITIPVIVSLAELFVFH